MATKRKAPKPRPKWARRSKRDDDDGPRRLDPDVEHIARGEKRPPRPRGPRGLSDRRPAPPIPGVKNTDARAVFDARIARLQRLDGGEDERALEDALAEAAAMGLWRGRRLTGFDALVADLLGMDIAEARARAEKGAARLDLPIGELSDVGLASWYRVEAALIEAGVEGAARLRCVDGTEELLLRFVARDAPAALAAIGPRQRGIARDLEPEREHDFRKR